jgi:hypothetical protein
MTRRSGRRTSGMSSVQLELVSVNKNRLSRWRRRIGGEQPRILNGGEQQSVQTGDVKKIRREPFKIDILRASLRHSMIGFSHIIEIASSLKA